ncbi:MAG: hypothetical protein OEX83_02570 [Gammaproteobacteria bacterium]|nr:hypothetical protein [Gammaproteobacteria bacterium]
MPKIITNNPDYFRKLMRLNVFFGLILFAAMFFLIVTGQYENLAARMETENLLNAFAIGGLLYSALFFILCRFTSPHLVASK